MMGLSVAMRMTLALLTVHHEEALLAYDVYCGSSEAGMAMVKPHDNDRLIGEGSGIGVKSPRSRMFGSGSSRMRCAPSSALQSASDMRDMSWGL